MKGVKFGGLHSFYEWGLILSEKVAGLLTGSKITEEEYEYIIGAQGSFFIGGKYENSIKQRNNRNS